ncbi:fumarate hydratase class II [Cupriavidus necator N-1]|uniref:Fumarate hydratase class II n=1 Tax=Cupriavidus necator (strain ATCC 43291 / DSM 13513 / CCUG 52238 / LMG 8453 / N-1) TaxID=1042878 RepID=F8GPS2_CUPNN|nr:class II fumarate hydratase [Cupriavidus necator]AEI80559.1 fumarate hydratase class II [Cupriavidus necator N-1]MDX6009814.1 class II fumarate hydratase [Cupriavidus necator]
MSGLRIEHDAFGPVDIPADRYWGAQTQRALAIFEVGEERFPACLVHAFGAHKMAAAQANLRCGVLDAAIAEAIIASAAELRSGQFDSHFPLTIWQTGSGTQTNMNANEVIANRANERLGQSLGTRAPVHPNDHVNASQSSNDSFPTVMHMTAALELEDRLLPALALLRDTLLERAHAFADVLKIARTHLMDAVPMTMGQAFEGFTAQVDHAIERVRDALPRMLLLPQGGTAAGTGLNAPAGFAQAFCAEASQLTGLAFRPNPCKVEGMAAHDALVELSGVLNVIAVSFTKIANDLRWLGSGPRCGLGELLIPEDGLTSSIMPGKRNPTIAEVMVQAAMQVAGNHVTVTMAGASGSFELNVAKPVLIYNVLQSVRVLADSARVFAQRLVQGLVPNQDQLARNLDSPLLAVTALNPVLGYDRAAQITTLAVAKGISPREAAIALGFLSGEEFDRLVNPMRLAKGNP